MTKILLSYWWSVQRYCASDYFLL